jgi:hypothetical protein
MKVKYSTIEISIIKKFILSFLILTSFISTAQKPIVFGVNFNSNWYDLTNLSKRTYWTQDEGAKQRGDDNGLSWVIVEFEYSKNKLDKRLLDLDLDETYMGFRKGNESNLSSLQPEMLLFSKIYNPNERFYEKAVQDRRMLEKMIGSNIGNETILFDDENAFAAKWSNQFGTAILTCRFDDHEIILMYLLKDSNKSLTLDKNGRILFN